MNRSVQARESKPPKSMEDTCAEVIFRNLSGANKVKGIKKLRSLHRSQSPGISVTSADK